MRYRTKLDGFHHEDLPLSSLLSIVMRVLIFRPDNIGDLILFSGALRHIRRLYPQAQITLAVQSHIVNLVEMCPYVDYVVSIDDLLLWKKRQRKGQWGFHHFIAVWQALERNWKRVFRRFDVVLYPVKSPQMRHLEIIYNLGVDKIIGIVGCRVNEPIGGYPDAIHPKKLYSDYLDVSGRDPWRHEILTTFDFLRFLGCEINNISDINPEFWISRPEQGLLNDAIDSNGTNVGLFPSASDDKRCWKVENYLHLIKLLDCEVDTVVIFGGPADIQVTSKLEALLKTVHSGLKIINLAGKTTLQELYKCISKCSVLIGSESVGLHMAIAAGIPTVGIVGGGHYGRFVPWGDEAGNIVLTKRLDCFNCCWRCSREQIECIQKVNPTEVASAANRLIRNRRSILSLSHSALFHSERNSRAST